MTGVAYDLSPLSGDPAPQSVRSAYLVRAPVIGVIVGGTVGFVALVTTLVQGFSTDREDVVIGLGFMASSVLIGLAVWLVARPFDRRAARRSARIAAFARANGFTFDGEAKSPGLPGVFNRGWQETVSDRVTWPARGLAAESARYYRRQNGTHTNCSYLAVRMDVAMEASTFSCGRSGPSARGANWKGADAFEGKPYSLRTSEHELDPRTRGLFDDPVVALLVDDSWPCNAEYLNGCFYAYYRSGGSADPGRWEHMLALADAVAARKPMLTGKS